MTSALQLAKFEPVGMVVVYDSILAADAASFDVQNIPQGYKHLKIVAHLRSTEAANQTVLWVRFNNDSGANYNAHFFYTTSGAATGVTAAAAATRAEIGLVSGDTATASRAGAVSIDIPDYAGTAFQKEFFSYHGYSRTGDWTTTHGMGHWASTAAINRITILPASGSWKAGSHLTIYGLGGAPQTADFTADNLVMYVFAK